jgi:hypothetical protein
LRLGPPKRIKNPALRFAIDQRLRVVLAVQVDELTPDLGQYRRGHGGTIYPGASTAVRPDLALEDERVIFDFDPVVVGQRGNSLQLRDIEHSFDRRLFRPRSDEIRARALAEQ